MIVNIGYIFCFLWVGIWEWLGWMFLVWGGSVVFCEVIVRCWLGLLLLGGWIGVGDLVFKEVYF